MIYIRVEMWPGGRKEGARVLGEATITNKVGDRDRAEYECVLLKSPEYAKPENIGKPWKKATVTDFPRLQLGPWDLLLRGLLIAIGKRNRGAIQSALTGRSIGVLLLALVSSREPLHRELLDLAARPDPWCQVAQEVARTVHEDPQHLFGVLFVAANLDRLAAVREGDRPAHRIGEAI